MAVKRRPPRTSRWNTEKERFFGYVVFPQGINGCWMWTGCIWGNGYGYFKRSGDRNRSLAHRFAYEAFVEPIPDGLVVKHSCDTPACVNPQHLTVGTQRENIQEAREKGRLGPHVLSLHCRRGHPLFGPGVQLECYRGVTRRRCRTCSNERRRLTYHRRHYNNAEVRLAR